ncbi:uncharacterized protein LOC113505661 [Trichoplusia ni]|uniref:Uncharacterized protein LOC113505661 n=1 Tax=Trichoplusia ni TaxID=7111 RepID=A0A7E5WUP6_TRINI|nr:uncharacterized protein LOC113505661 [Trichoplusia ni]
MKVIVAVLFALGSVAAKGSGPYLPSGWKPEGPSFYLPSEVSKPSDGPLKENLFQETEASGSEALREYGPPKLDEVIQILPSQALPDVATEQTFLVEAKVNQDLVAAVEEAEVEANTEQISAIVGELATATESQLAEISEEQTTEILSEAQPTLEAKAEIVEQTGVTAQEAAPTAAYTEENVQEEVVVPTAVAQEEVVPTVVEEIVEEQVVRVNNIAEAIESLEKEVKAEAIEGVVKIKQISGSLEQAPEGFLEYGPPGFKEYGPPKEDEIARSAAVELAPTSAFENNEVRRRRFSPKFRSTKKH